MTIKSIITVPDPILKTVSKPVDKVDKNTRILMDDMLETMYNAPGIGLAAIQIGVALRVIVMDIAWKKEDAKREPKFFINPEISNQSKETAIYEEGCLSIPNQYAEIERSATCTVKYLDYNGKECIEDADGLFATCVQHEMDHLEGILFIDYLSKLKKNIIVKKLTKQKKSSKERVVA